MAPNLISQHWTTLWAVRAILAMAAQVTIAQECNYMGGWSLRFPASSCPQYAPFDCGKAGDLQMRCCPTGFSCAGDGSYIGNYCCPDSTGSKECQELASEYPKCPDPTWSLWAANDTINNLPQTGAWCCAPGSMGIYRDNGTANYFCTTTTVTTLQTSWYWAQSLSTSSCSSTTPTAVSSTTTPAAVSSTTDHRTSAPSITTSPDSTNNGESHGVSGGVIAGAVVGSVSIITLITVGLFLYLRKKKLKLEVTQAVNMSGGYGEDTTGNGSKRRRVSELETVEPRLEMDGTKPTYELDATAENVQEEGQSPRSRRPI
ncbi:hypothetical protein LX32DRAFT_640951 [Colletotrichum zoysiae]|uniref:Uncharacterized protein n=1 Tax=Colletotrichum zoysiae TaxID=1216348 RepID=A0AAD9M004_9PEZI|nr:hypothetical protein LX32DRAFT_640951 [Colletotrichum zoysiae]